ncbi:DUF1870 family protein [Pectobacterium punjabense]|uniref:Aca2/YdiL-like domain-containing protein n=1 Tax=Pectobacterium punjabense TaxID=2108399 RepID=UPI00311F17C9
MTNKELQAIRKLLMLDVSEAAEHIGRVSPRSWQYWESGRSAVPDDVEQEMLDLASVRIEMMSAIDKRLAAGERPQLRFYNKLDEYLADNPDHNVIGWRLSQSVAALYYTEGHADLI